MGEDFRDRADALSARLKRLRDTVRRLGEAADAGARSVDRYTVAEHPDLDALNHELNNLYGQSFD